MHIVVVGGGPAGAVTAITLLGRGHQVTVLEASLEPLRKVGECLSPGANEILRALGLLNRMEAVGHLPSLGNRAFWGQATPVERDFLFGTKGGGWHLDRRRFETDLADIAGAAGVKWHAGNRVRVFHRERDLWQLQVDSPEEAMELECDFVIDATGRSRALARKLGMIHAAPLPQGEPDRLLGLSGILAAPDPLPLDHTGLRDRFTVVEAAETGWWYSALLGDGSLVVALMTDADLRPKGDPWSDLLARAPQTQSRIEQHGGQLTGALTVRSAAGSRLDQAHGVGWLAVGDAALAFDPLSSYGITSAMGTSYYAAHAIADTFAGDERALPIYQALLDQTWARYLQQHAEHYAIEKRWPDSPFWSRRMEMFQSC